MVEHCDKCGTELDESQARHHQYRFEEVHDGSMSAEGRLCADCLADFKSWLAAGPLTEN